MPPIDVQNATRALLTPTDVTQFVRLEQCERFLRLKMHEGVHKTESLWDASGAKPHTVTPLLRTSGETFEARIEGRETVSASGAASTRSMKPQGITRRADDDDNDNAAVLHEIFALQNSATRVLFQPRLLVQIGDWKMRGDLDILHLQRDENGALHILIADMKSSREPRVEHRLQVAFYREMVETLLRDHACEYSQVQLGIVYRGPDDATQLEEKERALHAERLATMQRFFGHDEAPLHLLDDGEKASYRESVESLVTSETSRAARIAAAEFDSVPFHIERKCADCRFQEFCLTRSVERDDLSLVPHLSAQEKNALLHNGITTVSELVALKTLRRDQNGENASNEDDASTRETQVEEIGASKNDLLTAPDKKELVHRIAATWPVGPRLDELVHRARRYRRWKGDDLRVLFDIPHKGHGTLPFSSAEHNPNLVRIYLDAQHDHLHDRVYLLGARVTACVNGVVTRSENIVCMSQEPPGPAPRADAPPADGEKIECELLTKWIQQLLVAVYAMAETNDAGEKKAPLHLIFWNAREQTKLLEALGRHATTILAATPLYDFLTQMPAFDSPNFSFLDDEIRKLKNFPLLTQSLQSVSEHLRFDWKTPRDFRTLFREGIFDHWGRFDDDVIPDNDKISWFTQRARFHSNIPLEYAYAAWNALPPIAAPTAGSRKAGDEFAPYRASTRGDLTAFQEKRLEAIEFIANTFEGNKLTTKAEFDLSQMPQFSSRAQTLAAALDEFTVIERHVELLGWKNTRQLAPERRVLAGDTLLVRYLESDQSEETLERFRDNARREKLRAELIAASETGSLKRGEAKANGADSNYEDIPLRLRLVCLNIDCDVARALENTTLREKENVVLFERHTFDSRLPQEERVHFTPTPKQMLYGVRGKVSGIERGENGDAWLLVTLERNNFLKNRGYVFGAIGSNYGVLKDGALLTIDSDPNDWYGYFCSAAVQELVEGARNTLYQTLSEYSREENSAAGGGQKRFLDGLDALGKLDSNFTFEPSKREYIGQHASTRVLLVQGPPGTGKSYATAFAILARMQNAMAEDREFRVFCGCKTHAATDVLIENVAALQTKLREVKDKYPELFAQYFDARLLNIPLFRLVRASTRESIEWLPRKSDLEKGQTPIHKRLAEEKWCVAATTPGGVYRLRQDSKKSGETLHGGDLCDCLVLDEASQMGLPEAIMAALTLKESGQIIVVGDDRQMAPIVKHNWEVEPRRTFSAFKSYDSLFSTLRDLNPPMIKFAESFRLHADIAEFLRREVYAQDGIEYHSKRTQTLSTENYQKLPQDEFLRAVLNPNHPLIVVVHEEKSSLLHNEFECKLMQPLLESLASPQVFSLNATNGFGVVVPHRAQKARLRERISKMDVRDQNGEIAEPPVDTVERFQGDERDAILVSATESDPAYLLAAGRFLMDPRRLNVALSRAKNKMILVASRSVFDLFSADEETFKNARLWKNLLRHTCTKELYRGKFEGVDYVVYGNEKQP